MRRFCRRLSIFFKMAAYAQSAKRMFCRRSASFSKMSPKQKSYYFRPLSRKIEAAYCPMRSDAIYQKLPLTGAANFEDFVNFLVGDPHFDGYNDGHWQSFDSTCQPCLHNYDVIVKMESIEEDMQFLRKMLKVPEIYNEVFLWSGPKLGHKMQHNETALFRQIPYQLVEKIVPQIRGQFPDVRIFLAGLVALQKIMLAYWLRHLS